MRRIAEEGAHFQSHLDRSTHLLTPEKVVEIQESLGSDIAMVLDECIPHDATREYVRTSTGRTIRWAGRSQSVHAQKDQLMFGLVRDGMYENLRAWCVRELTPMRFDGFAVGGLGDGVGEEMLHSVGAVT